MKTFTTVAVVASFLALAPAYAHSHMSTPFVQGGNGGSSMAQNGLGHVPADECADMLKNLWKGELRPFDSDRRGIGFEVDIRPYDDSYRHPAVVYCLKRQFNERGIELERDDFTSPKLINLILAGNKQLT